MNTIKRLSVIFGAAFVFAISGTAFASNPASAASAAKVNPLLNYQQLALMPQRFGRCGQRRNWFNNCVRLGNRARYCHWTYRKTCAAHDRYGGPKRCAIFYRGAFRFYGYTSTQSYHKCRTGARLPHMICKNWRCNNQ